MSRGAFMQRYPSNDSWEIAKSNPLIVNITYDKLLRLSKIYTQQESTFIPSDEMFELYKSANINKASDAKGNLKSMADLMNELVARERLLMHYYDDAKDYLGWNGKKK